MKNRRVPRTGLGESSWEGDSGWLTVVLRRRRRTLHTCGKLFIGLDYWNGMPVMTFVVSSQLHAPSPRGLIWHNLHHAPGNICWQLEPKDISGPAHAVHCNHNQGHRPWQWVNTSAKGSIEVLQYCKTKQQFNHYRITIHALLSVIHTVDFRCQLPRLVGNCSITHNLWKVASKDLPKKYGK